MRVMKITRIVLFNNCMPSNRSILIELHEKKLDPKQEYVVVKDQLVLKQETKVKALKQKTAVKALKVEEAKVVPAVEAPEVEETKNVVSKSPVVLEEKNVVVEEQSAPKKQKFGKKLEDKE